MKMKRDSNDIQILVSLDIQMAYTMRSNDIQIMFVDRVAYLLMN